jgi:hypothetical protein
MAVEDQTVVVDFIVGQDAQVWPMVRRHQQRRDHGRPRRAAVWDEVEVTMSTTHTLSVLVENKPGVLARVSGLFSRRGFNIESLAVGPTEHPDVSRMTIGSRSTSCRWSR